MRAPGSASYSSRLPWAWSSSQIARSRIRPCWRGPSAAITCNQPPAVRISRRVVSTSGAISRCCANPRAMSNRIAAWSLDAAPTTIWASGLRSQRPTPHRGEQRGLAVPARDQHQRLTPVAEQLLDDQALEVLEPVAEHPEEPLEAVDLSRHGATSRARPAGRTRPGLPEAPAPTRSVRPPCRHGPTPQAT
jgi:hypothetical protein